jgi:hypothetical protein
MESPLLDGSARKGATTKSVVLAKRLRAILRAHAAAANSQCTSPQGV